MQCEKIATNLCTESLGFNFVTSYTITCGGKVRIGIKYLDNPNSNVIPAAVVLFMTT